ncbi:PE family protein [Nocardia caishijiensis]|uniref:PE family protein n=1 Tax=Nocardia caishijiensis TaxID=184756 RepID=A0ABQ6YQZ2_9NOCA|nr:PE family protein [Nocardia caishijiensis]KAF0848252.1 PE family protein [Nocardia caishijiensis]
MADVTGEIYDGVQFDVATASQASSGLDALADRLAADLQAAEHALTVAPAGADEVSGRSAQTANEVASSYLTRAQSGVEEMRKLAATLRLQANRFSGMESDNTADFGGTPPQ